MIQLLLLTLLMKSSSTLALVSDIPPGRTVNVRPELIMRYLATSRCTSINASMSNTPWIAAGAATGLVVDELRLKDYVVYRSPTAGDSFVVERFNAEIIMRAPTREASRTEPLSRAHRITVQGCLRMPGGMPSI